MSEELEIQKPSLWDLFWSFAKVGVLTFGGGYAMLPMLERECVSNHSWATEDEMLDYYAIGQCTPGVIAVNTATFIGYKNRGVLGGIVASLGVVFPSFIIIVLLASVLKMFQDNVYVMKAFSGIRIAVCALILSAIVKLAKKVMTNIPAIVIAVLALLLQLFLGMSPVIIVAIDVAFGLIYFFVKKKEGTK